jgi:TPR repeat protein
MAKGDIETARRHFAQLAQQGVAEAALALGSTYDPVSIERAGMTSVHADRARAKQWYRRAIELAQSAAERQAPR